MKIEFFGHSICGKRQDPNKCKTFVDLILEHYNGANRWLGYANCSEERILYCLKKSEPPDVAIIFHADPTFIFTPSLSCDYHRLNDHELTEKFNYDAPKFFASWKQDRIFTNEEPVEIDPEIARKAFLSYYEFFTTPEVNRSRFYGALIQIDQYLTNKKIPVIHCPKSPKHLPKWFKFSSGIVDLELGLSQNANHPYRTSYAKSDNAVTEDGNKAIAATLIKYIDQLTGKV